MGILKKSIEFIKGNAEKEFSNKKGYTDTTRSYLTRLQITKVKQLLTKLPKDRKN